jgi:hypothetical protein
MQPYFFPYLGYFQLIKEVDIYVNLDHVSFMKRSYMTRNSLKDNTPFRTQVYKASQNKKCTEVILNFENNFTSKSLNTIHHLYSKSEYYDSIIPFIEPLFQEREITISQFNLDIIKTVCNLLEIPTKIINSSEGYTDKKRGDGLIEITKKLNGDSYVNAIGGQKLYDKSYFKNQNINLYFIKMREVQLDNPYASILDLLFTYPIEHIKNQLNSYLLL